jgi:DNA-directed RNA polymerase subunit K/omega
MISVDRCLSAANNKFERRRIGTALNRYGRR